MKTAGQLLFIALTNQMVAHGALSWLCSFDEKLEKTTLIINANTELHS